MDKLEAYGTAEIMAYAGFSMIAFHEFLGAKTLENRSETSESIYDFMDGFERVMQGLDTANGTRTATQPRDYVLSVWVDCKTYVVPSDFKTLPFGSALQNAMAQMDAHHDWNLLTTAPRGLFDSASRQGRSAFWHPEQYFSSFQVRNLRDAYSPVFTLSPFFRTGAEGRVLFRLAPGIDRPLALSAEAIDYDAFVDNLVEGCAEDRQLAKETMLSLLNRMVLRWAKLRSSHIIQEYTSTTMSDLCRELVGPWELRQPKARTREDLLFTFIMATLHGNDESAPDYESIPQRQAHETASQMLREQQWGLQDIKRPLYKMMAMALGLNMDVCVKKGVRIMVSGKGPDDMRLGLYRGDVDITSLKSKAEMDEVKSVKMNFHFGHKDIPKGGDLIYEAVKMGGAYNLAPFEVFGVWVPLHDRREGGWNAEAVQLVHMLEQNQGELGGFLF